MRVRYLVSAGAVLAAVALYALHREEVTINVNKPPSAAVVSPSSRPLGRGDVYETLGHLFIVGDVHGCLNEMQQLVNTYRTENETLVFVGDMTMKGPDSEGVIQQIMQWKGLAVKGNNDEKVLQAYSQLRSGDPRAVQIARQVGLSESSLAWMRKLPAFIRVQSYHLVIVHAGLPPRAEPEDTPEELLLNMRSVLPNGTASVWVDGLPWASVWTGPHFVVFGHDAVRSLQSYPYALGLDSGCVYGNQLSAVRWPSKQMVSVPCARKGKGDSDGAALDPIDSGELTFT